MAKSVLPSFHDVRASNSKRTFSTRINNDTSLHEGVVVAVYDPHDKGNYSKKVYEYDVELMTSSGSESPTKVTYQRCRLQTTFGGLLDKCIWTPRVQVKNKDGTIKEPGTNVLVECGNGISNHGIIIGATEPKGVAEQSQDFKDAPRLSWQFNGVDAVINKDGELVLTRKGPTTSEGKPVNKDDKKVNASVTLDKDGQVIFKTGDEKNVVTMNLNDGLISIKADKKCTIEVTGGKLETTASNGVKLGGDEKMVKGDTYVDAEKQFIMAFSTFLTQLSAVAATLGGAVIEPTSIAAGTQLTAAIQVFNPKLIVFQTHLETKDVLSLKNTTE